MKMFSQSILLPETLQNIIWNSLFVLVRTEFNKDHRLKFSTGPYDTSPWEMLGKNSIKTFPVIARDTSFLCNNFLGICVYVLNNITLKFSIWVCFCNIYKLGRPMSNSECHWGCT